MQPHSKLKAVAISKNFLNLGMILKTVTEIGDSPTVTKIMDFQNVVEAHCNRNLINLKAKK